MTIPPLDFLFDASTRALQDLEISARARSANLSKGLRTELDAWVEQEAIALLARWLIENREAILARSELTAQLTPKKAALFKSEEVKKLA